MSQVAEAIPSNAVNLEPPKKRKKTKVTEHRYPTQYMKLGDIRCLFFSFWNNGRSPVLSIGPSWPFTICLVSFAGLIFVYFMIMLSLAKDAPISHQIICYIGIAFNLFLLFGGILGNPGIPQSYIDKILKAQQGKGEDDDKADLESGSTHKVKNGIIPPHKRGRKNWC